MSVKETFDDRQTATEELRASIEEELLRGNSATLDLNDVLQLQQVVGCPLPSWQAETTKVHQKVERLLAECLGGWRKATRKCTTVRRAYMGGKSAWAIGYLESVRKLLLGWSLRGRVYSKINRLDREKQGTFAAGLLRHIGALKEDRVKAGSDLIVQAALVTIRA